MTPSPVLLSEIAAVLGEYGSFRCRPDVHLANGTVVVTVVVDAFIGTDALVDDVAHVRNVGQARMLAVELGIDPAQLEALIPPRAPREDPGNA